MYWNKTNPKFPNQEAQDVINEYFQNLQSKMSAKTIEEEKPFREQWQTPEVVTLKTGLQYEVIREGNGPVPMQEYRKSSLSRHVD